MSKFKIVHITRYKYENMVRDSANQILLYPVKDDYQEILDQTITVTGDPSIEIHQDYFGNEVGTFTQSKPHIELTIDSRLAVETYPRPMPEDKTPVEEQWKELERVRYQIQFIDFLKQERFEALPEVKQLIEDERCKNCTPLQS